MKAAVTNNRNARVEWLRVLCMLSVVAYHYSIWGFYSEELAQTGNKIFIDLISMPLWTSLQLFILISGYYMCEQRFTLKKLLNLMGTVWFYTLSGLLIQFFIDPQALSGALIRRALFPITTQYYWFISFYVALMLCSPFLNALIHRLDQRQHTLLCLLAILLCYGIPIVLDGLSGGTLSVFLTLYLCAAYIRRYAKPDRRTSRRCLLLALLLLGAYAAFLGLRDAHFIQRGETDAILNSTVIFWTPNSLIPIAPALLLLCCVATAEPVCGGLGARLGKLIIGVYLFQSNEVVSRYLWQDILHIRDYTGSPRLFLHTIGSVAAIFLAGLLVEYLRQISFGRLWSRLVERIAPPLETALNTALGGLLAILRFFLGGEKTN